jgi:hypothetical protein
MGKEYVVQWLAGAGQCRAAYQAVIRQAALSPSLKEACAMKQEPNFRV